MILNYIKKATGNWGCGIYHGILQLKFIEQCLAASFAGVQRLDYYTFGEKKMDEAIKYYHNIKNKNLADNVYKYLINFKMDVNNLMLSLQNLFSVPFA